MINQGRANNAARAVDLWHAATFDHPPSHLERVVYDRLIRIALESDDEYLAKVTAVADGRLRVHLAKAQEKIASLGHQVAELNGRISKSRGHERRVDARLAKTIDLEKQADGWRRSADAYVQQNHILREQLLAAGIEPDRRTM